MIKSIIGTGVVGKSVCKKMCLGTHFPRKFCPTGQNFLGKNVQPDRDSCPTLGKYVLGIQLLQAVVKCVLVTYIAH